MFHFDDEETKKKGQLSKSFHPKPLQSVRAYLFFFEFEKVQCEYDFLKIRLSDVDFN